MKTSADVAKLPASSDTPKQPEKHLNGQDSSKLYLQSELFRTVQLASYKRPPSMESTVQAGLDEKASSADPRQQASPFSQSWVPSTSHKSTGDLKGQEVRESQQDPLLPLSNGSLKQLECSTKEETIASLTAKVTSGHQMHQLYA